jgi:endonuclease IV
VKVIQTTLGERTGIKFPPDITPEKTDLNTLIIHANLLINLSNGVVMWKNMLQKTLYQAAKYLIPNPDLEVVVVVHIGKGPKADIDLAVDMVNSITVPPGVTLALENAAGQGNEIGKNWEELQYIFDRIPKKIALCIDTQHSFAAGLCRWQTKKEVDTFFQNLEEKLPGRISIFHLNDSETPYGSNVDRHGHQNLGAGEIWKDHPKGLVRLLEYLIISGIPSVLETADPIGDLATIEALIDEYKLV